MQTGETLIEVKDLCKYFRGGTVRALNGVSLTIGKGDVIVIIGPSGSGKSTFLRSLNMLETPTSGSVMWRGQTSQRRRTRRERRSTSTLTAGRWAWCSSTSIFSRTKRCSKI